MNKNLAITYKIYFIVSLSLFAGWVGGQNFFGYSKDYYWYNLFYDGIDAYTSLHFLQYEPGFVLLNYLSKYIGLQFDGLLSVLISITLCIKLWLISRGRYLFATTLIYVCLLFWLHELTQIRVSAAIAFFFLSIYYIQTGRRLLASVLYLVAVSFHVTSIFFFPVFLIGFFNRYSAKLTKSCIFILFLSIGLLMAISILHQFHPNGSSYLNNDSEFIIFSYRGFALLSILFVFYFIPKPLIENRLYFVVVLNGIISATVLSDYPVLANRVFEFSIFAIVLIVSGNEFVQKRSAAPIFMLLFFSILFSTQKLYFEDGYFSEKNALQEYNS